MRVTRTLIVLGIAALAMQGCAQAELIILTNATAGPIRVRYTVTTFRTDANQPERCAPRVWPPQERPTPTNNQWPASEWRTADAKLDAATCEAEFVLAAGHSALVDRNGFCDDYKKDVDRNPALQPGFRHFALESGGRTFEWRGWDTAKQFRRNSQGDCIYRIS